MNSGDRENSLTVPASRGHSAEAIEQHAGNHEP